MREGGHQPRVLVERDSQVTKLLDLLLRNQVLEKPGQASIFSIIPPQNITALVIAELARKIREKVKDLPPFHYSSALIPGTRSAED